MFFVFLSSSSAYTQPYYGPRFPYVWSWMFKFLVFITFVSTIPAISLDQHVHFGSSTGDPLYPRPVGRNWTSVSHLRADCLVFSYRLFFIAFSCLIITNAYDAFSVSEIAMGLAVASPIFIVLLFPSLVDATLPPREKRWTFNKVKRDTNLTENMYRQTSSWFWEEFLSPNTIWEKTNTIKRTAVER